MKNGQKVTINNKSSAYYGYKGLVTDYHQNSETFYIQSETSRLIMFKGTVKSHKVAENAVKGRACDVCGLIPMEIYFDSRELNIVYHCKECDPQRARIGVVRRTARLIKRILIEPRGFTC